jgi:hypothetical protein
VFRWTASGAVSEAVEVRILQELKPFAAERGLTIMTGH